MKPDMSRISQRQTSIVALLVLNCLVAWVVVDILWLLAIVAVVIVGLILALVQDYTPPESLRQLTVAPDHVGVAGKRIALKDVRRIEQLTAAGTHDVVLHTGAGTVLAARVAERTHAGYIADRIDDAYRAFLRRGSLS